MNSYLIVATIDTNDADYVVRVEEIVPEASLKLIKEALQVVKDCKEDHNWPRTEDNNTVEELYKGLLTTDQINLIDNLLPSGAHTIIDVKAYQIEDEITLL